MFSARRDTSAFPPRNPKPAAGGWLKSAPRWPHGLNPTASMKARCGHRAATPTTPRLSNCANPKRVRWGKNDLLHAFCTYHFALHGNENLTAAQAGNSPSVIHQAYKGLATKAEAEKWFAVKLK